MGYIDYYDTKELQEKASKEDSSVTTEATEANEKIYQKYIDKLGNGWKLQKFPLSGEFYAVREVPVYERVFEFYANLIQIDHPNVIQDEENPNLERYIRFEMILLLAGLLWVLVPSISICFTLMVSFHLSTRTLLPLI